MKHFLVYTGARLGLLVVVGGLAFAVGMRGLLLLLVAFLGSGLLSLFVLRGSRAKFGTDVGGFFRRINDRIDEASRKEDVDLPGAAADPAADTRGPAATPGGGGHLPE